MNRTWSPEWRRLDKEHQDIISNVQTNLPVKVAEIATTVGLKVSSATLPADISGEIKPDGTADAGFHIRVNRNENKLRQRFTVAHELGHYFLHRNLINDGLSDSIMYRTRLSNKLEAQANRLAADILMPPHRIKEYLDKIGGLPSELQSIQWANEYGVSHLAMKIRLGIL